MTAMKVLCKSNADVNRKHKKNGYTPLRVALENQLPDMVSIILEHRNFNIHLQNDFGNISPFQAAASKEPNDEIKKIIQTYLVRSCYFIYYTYKILSLSSFYNFCRTKKVY